MAENKKIKKCPVSLQPDIENLLQDLTPDDFASASSQEKEDFIQDRQSVSYWKDAWRRLKKNNKCCKENSSSHDNRIVTVLNRLYEITSQSRDREYTLYYETTA